MKLISRFILCTLLGLFIAVTFCANGLEPDDEPELEYLQNPFAADMPEWDPFGPGQESDYAAGRADWDPYSPSSYDVPQLISANPFTPDQDLSFGDEVLSPNQLYLQSNGLLVTRGQVDLATPYSLWLYIADWGPLTLYDRGRRITYQGFMSPGWYRLDRYAETLESHYYRFNTSTWSNNVTISVSSAGYPTSYGLVGKVVDSYGNGIAGARARISGSEGGIFSTVTNGLGYYGMDLPSGTYIVTAELEGFSFSQSTARVWTGTVSAAGTVVGYPAGGMVYPTNSYQDESGWLEGVVTDKSGTVVPGAKVRVDGLFSVTTDEGGSYWVSLSPGWHSITVDASGYKFSSETVQIFPQQGSKLDFQGIKVIVLGSGKY